MEKTMKNANLKELFEKLDKSKDKVMEAGTKMCEMLDGLTLPEATITVSHLLGATIENTINVLEDVEASFEITSSVLVEIFLELRKKYGLDFLAVLNKNYLKRENPEMFKLIEEKFGELQGKDNDDEDEDEEQEGDGPVC